MLYGFSPLLPGQILNPNDEQESVQQLQALLETQQKRVSLPAIQPSAHNTPKQFPDVPKDCTHVYTKQHKALGLQASFAGPFPIVEWVSKSTVKIKVGQRANGDPTFEIRHLNDLKFAHPNSHTSDATRVNRGRPKKNVESTSTWTDPEIANSDNEPLIAAIDFSRPPPNLKPWSATQEEIKNLNAAIQSS